MTRAAPVDGRLTILDRAPSTQDLVHQLGEEGAPHGTALFAREQVGARGTRGRPWHAPLGGLWLSVLLRPTTAAAVELLSLRIGLALARALERETTVPLVGLKWPNDLMVGDRKVGGILCEARWRGDRLGWIAVGVGINVRNPVPDEVRTPATRLADHDPAVTAEAILEPVVEAIRTVECAPGGLSASELDEFRHRDRLRGRMLLEPAPGRADGVAPDGALLVLGADGQQHSIRSGTVVLGPGEA